jgi:hypothetical protein
LDDKSRSPATDLMDNPLDWPVVSPGEIGIAEWDWDLAYMGVYLRLEICNRSPYLVREATLRIDGRGQTTQRVVTSREVTVGPLFPGVYVHEEVGVGAREGISGVSFDLVTALAVRLTPPSEMVPAATYADLVAEIVEVIVDEEAPDLRPREGELAGEPPTAVATAIRIRVRNTGPGIVERARLRLRYFEAGGQIAGRQTGLRGDLVAEWILDMPQSGWNPYRLPAAPDAVCDPADPLPPGQVHEFTLVHYDGGPHGWAGRLDAVSVEVCEVKLGVSEHA